jgi:hypothetical protein
MTELTDYSMNHKQNQQIQSFIHQIETRCIKNSTSIQHRLIQHGSIQRRSTQHGSIQRRSTQHGLQSREEYMNSTLACLTRRGTGEGPATWRWARLLCMCLGGGLHARPLANVGRATSTCCCWRTLGERPAGASHTARPGATRPAARLPARTAPPCAAVQALGEQRAGAARAGRLGDGGLPPAGAVDAREPPSGRRG